ncbi:heavy metal translocating P-type ATPase [Jeotgalibacillus salarius]|uniref:Cd(2+)-exporting ATPase n=1 Tax=Jeotgalibacillus salarius TaxID=546023 RepID=A0A4Y8LLI4_9BACL|nr:heavy metal translocating P-type ATPase [Jeotgalibacillus salarius]TFE02097.1 cadmium-translocating P-type ATPase [Jeotgalibacillus salarius]
MEQTNEKTYRVSGFSCAGCANTFEKNVKNLQGVEDAQVNFGASKITVRGDASIDQLEKAGAFERLRVTSDREAYQPPEKTPFLNAYWHVIAAFVLTIAGFITSLSEAPDWVPPVLFGGAIVTGGYSLFITGFKNLARLNFDMRTLMTIAVIGAALIGEWGEGAVVVILFAISEALERYSMDKARASIRSLMDISPKTALVRGHHGEMETPVEEVNAGDIMIVKPGDKVALDGVIVKGRSTVNQAAITGESVPAEKDVSDTVYAGTLNQEGVLEVEVTRRSEDTTLAKIIHMVEEAQADRAPSQAFVDRFAKVYTPVIIVIAFLVAILPPLIGGAEWSTWIYQGLAVLVVGCPCALVISTPVAIVTAIGNAAKRGVLIKGGVYLEEMGRLDTIAFDKTGTLTKGKPAVTDVISLSDMSEKELLNLAAALEHHSRHPLASAILERADADVYQAEDVQAVTGKGMTGSIEGIKYKIGKPSFFDVNMIKDNDMLDELLNDGKTVMVFGTEEAVLGFIAVADETRSESYSVIERLHQLGIKDTIMLTGDNKKSAAAVGTQTGVTSVRAELLPEDKLAVIKQLRADGRQVAMVGDGINDAPALAASTVGVAMGGAGTDTAMETADIALMADDLEKLPFTVKLSRKALWIIKQNIIFSIGVKVLALMLVVPGWLTLWIAIFADLGATLLVTLNGMRLLKVKDDN